MEDKLCIDHGKRLGRMEETQQKQEVELAKIAGNINHIKSRIDNGMSSTITKIYDKLVDLAPVVADNQDIVGRVKAFTFWIVTIGIGGGLVSFAFHLLKNVGA